MGKRWTIQNEEEIIKYRNDNLTAEEVATLIGRTTAAVKLRYAALVKAGRLCNKGNGRHDHLSNDQLLELLKKYRKLSAWRAAIAEGESLPYPDIMNRRFGSWGNALDLAGITIDYGLQKDKPTKLYLIHFIEEDFYKVGITQQKLSTRFKSYPEFNTLEVIEFPCLEFAKEKEKLYLSLVKEYKYLPLIWGPSGGHTECFQTLDKISCFADLLKIE